MKIHHKFIIVGLGISVTFWLLVTVVILMMFPDLKNLKNHNKPSVSSQGVEMQKSEPVASNDVEKASKMKQEKAKVQSDVQPAPHRTEHNAADSEAQKEKGEKREKENDIPLPQKKEEKDQAEDQAKEKIPTDFPEGQPKEQSAAQVKNSTVQGNDSESKVIEQNHAENKEGEEREQGEPPTNDEDKDTKDQGEIPTNDEDKDTKDQGEIPTNNNDEDEGFEVVDGMVKIPGGTFIMGSNRPNESPRHRVTLSSYWIDQTEVTYEAYMQCVAAKKCTKPRCSWKDLPNYEQFPVSCVSWRDARAYCKWAGKRMVYEAEWEFAARGEDGRLYPWGKDKPNCELTVYRSCKLDHPKPVKSTKDLSPFGVYDLSGNVSEWVYDALEPYPKHSVKNPHGPRNPKLGRKAPRVIRGGNYLSDKRTLWATYRRGAQKGKANKNVGFRCAKDID